MLETKHGGDFNHVDDATDLCVALNDSEEPGPWCDCEEGN